MMPVRLEFRDRRMQGPHFHLATVEWARNRIPGYHDHDYCEIFWLIKGCCEHFINGRSEALGSGTLVLMRPEDAHLLRPAARGGGFEFANLALSPEVFKRLRKAYPEEVAALYGHPDPLNVPLSPGNLEMAGGIIRQLASSPHTLLTVESAVLQIWKLCLPKLSSGSSAEGPDWLRVALIKLDEPEVLSRGVSAFIKLAGRSHAHVSRSCREAFGKTPTQLVSEARMRHAAHLLRTTSESVLEISFDCGFENPAQFHRVFQKAFGTSPRRFRCL